MTTEKVPGMAVHALAGEIVEALLSDEKDGGYDLEAGMFGRAFSALVRRWAAAEWSTAAWAAAQAPSATALTLDQAEVVTAFTGVLMMPLPEFHCRITKELGYPVVTHEMGAKAWWAQVKEVYRDRFVALCATGAAPDA